LAWLEFRRVLFRSRFRESSPVDCGPCQNTREVRTQRTRVPGQATPLGRDTCTAFGHCGSGVCAAIRTKI